MDQLREDGGQRYHALVDGNTLHGMQSLDPKHAKEPLLYFYRGSPVSDVFLTTEPKSVAVIGLGAGSLACYARPGASWTFFELDPDIAHIAQNKKLFTLLPGCDPRAHVVLGDGRLQIAKRADHSYDGLYIADGSVIKEPRLWDYVTRQGKSSIVLSVPGTYPPRPLNGVMVSVIGQLQLHFVPFEKLIDPETLVTKVRYIEPNSDFHRLARFLETYVNE